MSQSVGTSLTAHFAQVPDPRLDRTKDQQLLDMLVVAICAILCGAGWRRHVWHKPRGLVSDVYRPVDYELGGVARAQQSCAN